MRTSNHRNIAHMFRGRIKNQKETTAPSSDERQNPYDCAQTRADGGIARRKKFVGLVRISRTCSVRLKRG